jgi:predicted transcriptional regulator
LRTHNPDEPINIRPGTNEAAIVKLLYANPHLGFTPTELEEQLDIAPGSVSTTLSRLLEKGYIGKTADGLYHSLDDELQIGQFARSLVKLDHIATTYPNAGFDADLVEDVDDEETDQQPVSETRQTELETEQHTTDVPLGDDLVIDDHVESDDS